VTRTAEPAARPGAVAIMQPTFLPWAGYFALMLQAERFVFLDSVQFVRRSWQQRNRIKTPDGPLWLTVPVLSRGAREQLISEVRIDDAGGWIEKMIRTITHHYARAPHFAPHAEAVFAILRKRHERLADLNIELIGHLQRVLGFECELIRSSALGGQGHKADLLASICEELGAKTYVAAVGSKEYIDESTAFRDRGIEVRYNTYQALEYPQMHGPFEGFLSVLDLLLNVGPESGAARIRDGLAAP
jgi:hypothetical protein